MKKHKSVKVPGKNAVRMINKFFPRVTNVKDADDDVQVQVTSNDDRGSKKKNHAECALAVACKRQQKADGVLVSVSTAYIIKGDTAIRLKLPESASREVISFDRDGGFEPGNYTLKKPCATERLDNIPYKTGRENSGVNITGRKMSGFVHKTERIRTSLNKG